MDEAHAFFSGAVVRAAGGSSRFIERVDVQRLPHRGWRLLVHLADGRALKLRATLGAEQSYREGALFGWSYENTEAALDEIAARLCERLARDSGPVPEHLRSAPGPEPEDDAEVEAEVEAEPEFERVDVELPGDCDRACVFCANSWDPARKPGEHLDIVNEDYQWRALERRIRELADARDPAKTRIEWSGRDALASPFFERALELAHGLGFGPMSVQSPGTRLAQREFVDRVAELGVRHVSLTAHASTPARFDAIGGRAGAHEDFWSAVTNLESAGVQVYFEVPIIRENLDELADLVERLGRREAPICLFYWHADPGSESAYDARPLPLGELGEHLGAIAQVVPQGRVSIVGVPPCARPLSLAHHFIWGHSSHHPIENHRQAEACSRCQVSSDCPGLPRGYWDRFPALVPVDAVGKRAMGGSGP